jgi:hypothetical protein
MNLLRHGLGTQRRQADEKGRTGVISCSIVDINVQAFGSHLISITAI